MFAFVAGVALTVMPVAAQAQQAFSETAAMAAAPVLLAAEATPLLDAPVAPSSGKSVLRSLYVSYAVLQALDVHSTTRALKRGGVESNPLMAGAAGSPMALTLVKAGGAAATIVLAEKLGVRNRLAATLLMAGVNTFYGAIVAHNYRIAGR